MTNQFPNQFWDVYAATPDSDEQYRGKMLFADPEHPIPDEVLRNFTLKEKGREFVMVDGALSDYQRVAANGFVLSTIA